jgi:molybdopterin-guanine dinucleotide biosynthesis protein A
MLDVEGFILTGGKSSRMGTDKAGLLLGAQSFTEKIAVALSAITEVVRVVGTQAQGSRWEIVPDVYSEWGALGGLHAALDACRKPWAAIVACDLPFVTGELFSRLASFSKNFEAIAPVQADGRLQPLCALYRRSACLPRVEELIATGERRPRALLKRVITRFVAASELSDMKGAELFFTNVNTPEDYARAKTMTGGE